MPLKFKARGTRMVQRHREDVLLAERHLHSHR